MNELKHAVECGQVGDDGKETIRALNYNAICSYAGKTSNTSVEPNSEGSTGANQRSTAIDQNHLLTHSATIML
ncbi:MAG: hypothetical protein ACKPKO_63955 [Candidatus Fonsibacter sp.]